MALIQCPECGRQVSDRASACPNCGCPINAVATTASQQVAQQEEEDNNVYYKCSSCGEVYYADLTEDNNAEEYGSLRDVSQTCRKCGGEIEISYFHYCAQCEHYVGFRPASWGRVASSVAENFVNGFLNPLETIGGLIDLATDEYPSASAAGTCQFCGTDQLLCPNCNSSFAVEPDNGFDTKWQCPHCGQVMYQP